ncbi:MAG: Mur ligase family protein, partial [Lachnospiraceae bacterium]|nr:Mur ligase family protein [Lachnospiraceae bacterium]
MTQIDSWVAGKKVLLLGFGREGQSTYRMLQRTKAYKTLAISDQMAKNWLPDEEIDWITGPDYQKTMDDYDVVFKSPGIVLERPVEDYRCRILSQTEVFFQLFREQIVGITGTKGKSTTTSLLYHILKSAGRRAMIAGNIGIPAFDRMDEIEEDTEIVFELSCHQLEYMTVSPHTAVLLNIHEEHLDHYGTMEKYVAAKEQIYRNQKPGDVLLCNVQCLPEEGSCRAEVIPAVDLGEDGRG